MFKYEPFKELWHLPESLNVWDGKEAGKLIKGQKLYLLESCLKDDFNVIAISNATLPS